jgi:hypothetical protein
VKDLYKRGGNHRGVERVIAIRGVRVGVRGVRVGVRGVGVRGVKGVGIRGEKEVKAVRGVRGIDQ